MKFAFSFDTEKVSKLGSDMDRIYEIISEQFEKRGLICVNSNDTLEFEDTGNEHDYANMWNIVLNLIEKDWFCNCATKCVYFEEDEDIEGEDVLGQIDNLKRIMA